MIKKIVGFIVSMFILTIPLAFLTANAVFNFSLGSDGLTAFVLRISEFLVRTSVWILAVASVIGIGVNVVLKGTKEADFLSMARKSVENANKRSKFSKYFGRTRHVIITLCLIGISYGFTAFLYLVGITFMFFISKMYQTAVEEADKPKDGFDEHRSLLAEVEGDLKRR